MLYPLISPQMLAQLIRSGEELVLVDARTGPEAKEKYKTQQLKGAVYVALEHDLAPENTDAAAGGRHPLPHPANFCQLLSKLGIARDSDVVVYDALHGANAASRFWWMLRATGHEKVRVLDGGYAAAIAAGVPTASGKETPLPAPLRTCHNWQLPTATIHEVAAATQHPHALVLDVRNAERYRGETEPIDLVAGHIPGAVNIPFKTNLNSDGFFRSPEALRAHYKTILADLKPEQVIVHCGSGVTACHTILALESAGLGTAKLYVGSWSEWSRSGRLIATGDQN